uniref:Uncharacterized protein n=1 Tax=Rhizophora mucronata TaxID=61149 RepID=A0A2P2NKE5_RHIMU
MFTRFVVFIPECTWLESYAYMMITLSNFLVFNCQLPCLLSSFLNILGWALKLI